MTTLPHRGNEVRKISSSNIEGMVVVGSSLDHFLENNGDPEELFSHNVQLLKSGDSTRNALARLSDAKLEGSPEEIFVKEFRSKNILHSLKPRFSRHRAQMAWQISWHLLDSGIPVPEPEGYLLRKSGPFYGKGYFFSKVLSGCNNLATLAWTSKELSKRLATGGLLDALAREIAALHGCGVTHGDLKWPNILVHETNNRIWFVDLDSANLHTHFLGPSRVARDLGRFVFFGFQTETNNAIIRRFLEEYCRHRKLDRGSVEASMAKILKKLCKRHKSIAEDRIKELLKNY